MLKCTCHADCECLKLNRLKVGIVARGLIIVTIPLAFSCFFVTTLLGLQREAEIAAQKATHDQQVSTLLSELIHDLYMAIGSVKLRMEKFSTSSNRKEQIISAKEKISKLIPLLQNEDAAAAQTLPTPPAPVLDALTDARRTT